MKVLTVSRTFPAYHPRRGEPTYFVEKILKAMEDAYPDQYGTLVYEAGEALGYKYADECLIAVDSVQPKLHTIRAGNRWKVGDMASLRYWSGRPYNSKQIEFAQVEIKKVWLIEINGGVIYINNNYGAPISTWSHWFKSIAANDGLSVDDLKAWFKMPVKKPFIGQIICWSDKVNY